MTHPFRAAFLTAACVRLSVAMTCGRATWFPRNPDFLIFKTGVVNSCLAILNKLFWKYCKRRDMDILTMKCVKISGNVFIIAGNVPVPEGSHVRGRIPSLFPLHGRLSPSPPLLLTWLTSTPSSGPVESSQPLPEPPAWACHLLCSGSLYTPESWYWAATATTWVHPARGLF